ncbi:hypothetical protein M3Y94_00448800 [Aphelenchoides besseyi]|nr:hypothetical protein M3Y94_00448800 [Aphelenchoides besseyi]KAI6229324.1 hypothetical protein M3Y95_00519100 [Aphelenchoides besseyi]
MNSMTPRLRNTAFNIVNHKETNVIVTAFLLFLSIYIALVAILDRNIVDPLSYQNISSFYPPNPINGFQMVNESFLTPTPSTTTISTTTVTNNDTIDTLLSIIQPQPTPEVVRYSIDSATTILSLFFLWIVALTFGRIVSYVYLPPLLGMLIAGMLIRNVLAFAEFWRIDMEWDHVLRQSAFILILIRCGLNIDPEVLRKSLGIFTSLGLISTTFEALAIVLAAHFLFYIPVPIAILFGYVLTSSSPAVTVPSIIRLQEQGYGTDKGIPTMILAASNMDNIYCITAFSVVASVIFTQNEDLGYLITRIPVEILVGALIGILVGLLLRVFPRNDVDSVHFVRSVFLCSSSVALLFGTHAIGCDMAGPVAVFLVCVISSMRWKIDNHQATRKEEHCYRILWDVFFQPFLFTLIGLQFDFSQMSWEILWNALAIIFIGVAVRFIAVLIMSFFMGLEYKEQIFVAICFFPKATVQAALAPLIIQFSTYGSTADHMQTVFQTCVLSILVTAPIGQLMIDFLGKMLLNKHVELTKRGLEPLSLPSYTPPEREPSFKLSDADNRLRLKVNGKSPAKSPVGTVTPLSDPPKFDEINQQAFEIFKEQRMGKQGSKLTSIDELQTERPISTTGDKPTKF